MQMSEVPFTSNTIKLKSLKDKSSLLISNKIDKIFNIRKVLINYTKDEQHIKKNYEKSNGIFSSLRKFNKSNINKPSETEKEKCKKRSKSQILSFFNKFKSVKIDNNNQSNNSCNKDLILYLKSKENNKFDIKNLHLDNLYNICKNLKTNLILSGLDDIIKNNFAKKYKLNDCRIGFNKKIAENQYRNNRDNSSPQKRENSISNNEKVKPYSKTPLKIGKNLNTIKEVIKKAKKKKNNTSDNKFMENGLDKKSKINSPSKQLNSISNNNDNLNYFLSKSKVLENENSSFGDHSKNHFNSSKKININNSIFLANATKEELFIVSSENSPKLTKKKNNSIQLISTHATKRSNSKSQFNQSKNKKVECPSDGSLDLLASLIKRDSPMMKRNDKKSKQTNNFLSDNINVDSLSNLNSVVSNQEIKFSYCTRKSENPLINLKPSESHTSISNNLIQLHKMNDDSEDNLSSSADSIEKKMQEDTKLDVIINLVPCGKNKK